MRALPVVLALAFGLGCLAPPQPQQAATRTYLACDHAVRPASGPYGLMFGDSARVGWVCREVIPPPLPEMPELSREGLPDGPGIVVEKAP